MPLCTDVFCTLLKLLSIDTDYCVPCGWQVVSLTFEQIATKGSLSKLSRVLRRCVMLLAAAGLCSCSQT